MKVTELMIGDWVLHFNKPCKVLGIKDIHRGHDAILLFGQDGFRRTGIKPIPLTPEILEKNGWINKEEKGWMQKGNFGDSPLMLWYIKDTGKFDPHFAHELEMSDLSKDGGFRIKVQCNYVHELQRALRCCGLWDLAENFKIN